MLFRDLAAFYDRLGATPKRLEMRSILVELLRPLRGSELSAALYLSQGLLRPEYEGVELGVADSLARRAIAAASGASDDEVGRLAASSGDLGETAAELLGRAARPADIEPLDVVRVYDRLIELARASGLGSQELKIGRLVDLLGRASPTEAKYLVRFVLGTMRVGVREMTLLDALAEAFAPGQDDARERVEAAFNLTSDLGSVAERLAADGVGGLSRIRLEVGRPIRPMLAERSKDLADVLGRMDGRAAFEYKYDGLRVQAHVAADGAVRIFSRRLEEIGPQFPELVAELPKRLTERPAILEGECVPVDPGTREIRPFQEVSRRRGRTHDLERMQAEVPVVLFAFDVLLAGDDPVYQRPFPERRRRLELLVRPDDRIRLAEQRIVTSAEEGTRFFEEAVARGAEGIMAKSLADDSTYRAGGRGFWWIKYKREYVASLSDSIDGVVVGAFHGRGRRGGKFGAFLLAVYNPKLERFESFCKVGSGFDDAALASMPERLKADALAERPPGIETGLEPDQWFRPRLVLEVRGAELTVSPVHRAGIGSLRPGSGLALRFPRFTGRYRDDKGPIEATTTTELLEMYSHQGGGETGPTPASRLRPKA